jgi:hypothetical protein
VEHDSSYDSFDIQEQGRGEIDDSFFVDGVVRVSGVDGGGEVFSGKVMFSDKAPVNAGDTSDTVNEHSGVDSFQGVQGFNELYWDLHGGSRGYNYSSYLGNRRVLCQWRSPF